MITLSIAGATPLEVAQQVQGFYHQLALSAETMSGPGGTVPEPEVTADAPQEDVLPPPEKPKTTRKSKAEAKAEPKQVDLEEAIADAAPAPPIEDVRAALMKLSKAKGDDAVWNMLEKFKAKSASTVAEGDRAKLIAEVGEVCK